MPYQVVIQENPDHMRVQVSGQRTRGREVRDAIGVLAQVADTCQKKGITRILIVWDMPGSLPTMAAYDLADSAPEWGWDRRLKLAMVHVYGESLESNLFTETVAINRGFRVKMFDDEHEAKSWLLET